MVEGEWEPGVTRLFGEVLEAGMVVIDAGAHVGYFTLLAARSVGPIGRVFAFEPVPRNYDLLVRNIELNGYRNIVPVQKAISNIVGSARFFIHPDTVGHSLFAETSSKTRRAINVEVTTLDHFLEGEGWPPVHLVKMDIEGAEPAALEGMTGLLTRNRALRLVVEYVPHILKRAGEDPTRFLDRLRGLGFTIRAIGSDGPRELVEKTTKNPRLRAELLCERNSR
jgi:FkbM family methyltransferase